MSISYGTIRVLNVCVNVLYAQKFSKTKPQNNISGGALHRFRRARAFRAIIFFPKTLDKPIQLL